jgi:hypothetical protein
MAAAQDTAGPRRDVYKVEISLRDTEPNQKPNLRRFAMLVEEGGQGQVNTSGRLAYPVGPGNWNFTDVGVRITCMVRDVRETLTLRLEADITDFVGSGPANPQVGNAPPTTTRHSAQVDTSVAPGKPTAVAAWDDPATKKRYELEATVTRAGRP